MMASQSVQFQLLQCCIYIHTCALHIYIPVHYIHTYLCYNLKSHMIIVFSAPQCCHTNILHSINFEKCFTHSNIVTQLLSHICPYGLVTTLMLQLLQSLVNHTVSILFVTNTMFGRHSTYNISSSKSYPGSHSYLNRLLSPRGTFCIDYSIIYIYTIFFIP